MVPLPRNAQQCCGANNDHPPKEPEQVRSPHNRREHDKRCTDQQPKNLLYVVRSRRACKAHQESLGHRRFRESHTGKGDEEDAECYDQDSGHHAHGVAGVSTSRITPQFSGRTLRCPPRSKRIMKWRACCAHVSTYHGPLQLLVRRQRDVCSTPADHRQSPVNPHARLSPTSGLAAAPIAPTPTAAAPRAIADTAAFFVA